MIHLCSGLSTTYHKKAKFKHIYRFIRISLIEIENFRKHTQEYRQVVWKSISLIRYAKEN